jgi:hypothetical protein
MNAEMTEIVEARSRKFLAESRLTNFKALCPPQFCKPINRDLIPDLTAWDAADAWVPGTHPGLWLWSPETGRAKTRMAWRLVERGIVRLGLDYGFITGHHLGERMYEDWRDGTPADTVRRFVRKDFVVIDDIDKFPFGDERLARGFRELFDVFYTRQISVLATSNEPISFIAQRLGASCERRLREVCREVRF